MWVCEDDEEALDGTRSRLSEWVARSGGPVRLIMPRPGQEPHRRDGRKGGGVWSRERRLALCRNTLLGEARAALPPRGVLVVLDLDCVQPAGLPAAVAALRLARYDVFTANTQGGHHYRDKWALCRPRSISRDLPPPPSDLPPTSLRPPPGGRCARHAWG